MRQQGHLHQVDYIRCFASLVVAIFHLGGKALPVLNYGWLGVELFFVLSGFIICWAMPMDYSLKMSGTFLLKRIIRIEPPYLISIALLLGLDLVFTANYQFSWLNVFCHIAYLNTFFNQPFLNPVYWTLGIEFHFYLLIALLFPLVVKPIGKWLVLALCLFTSLFHFPPVALTTFFPLFGMGIMCFLYKRNLLSGSAFPLFFVAVTICTARSLGWLQTGTGLIAALVIMLPLKRNGIIGFFSKISYSLYLIHDFVGSLFIHFCHRIFPHTLFYKGAIFITGLVFTILSAAVFYRLVERPAFEMARRIKFQA